MEVYLDIMSEYEINFSNHQFHKSCESVLTSISTIEEMDSKTEFEIDFVSRIKKHFEIAVNILKQSDPELVSISTLDQLSNYSNTINTKLAAFINDRNVNHLREVDNTIINNWLVQLSLLNNLPRNVEELETLRDSIRSFKQMIAQYNRNLGMQFSELKDSYEDLDKEFTTLEETIQSEKMKVTSYVDQEYERIKALVNEQEVRFAEYENDFKSAQDDRTKNFEKELESLNKSFQNKIETFIQSNEIKYISLLEKAIEKEKTFITHIEEVHEELQNHKEKSAELLSSISINTLAGGYKEVADSEKVSKEKWNNITIGTLIVLIIVAIGSTMFSFYSFSWHFLLGKFTVLLALGTLATYAGRLAKSYETTERSNRNIQLRLQSFDPYLVSIEDAQIKSELRKSMTPEFFKSGDKSSIISEDDLKGLIINFANKNPEKLNDLFKNIEAAASKVQS